MNYEEKYDCDFEVVIDIDRYVLQLSSEIFEFMEKIKFIQTYYYLKILAAAELFLLFTSEKESLAARKTLNGDKKLMIVVTVFLKLMHTNL